MDNKINHSSLKQNIPAAEIMRMALKEEEKGLDSIKDPKDPKETKDKKDTKEREKNNNNDDGAAINAEKVLMKFDDTK